MTPPKLHAVAPQGDTTGYDALVLVATPPLVDHASRLANAAVASAVQAAVHVDAALAKGSKPPVVLPVGDAPGGRLVIASLGPLAEDTDDVRAIAEATSAAVARAVDAGARRPLIAVGAPSAARFGRAAEVAALSALASQWAPLEAREAEKALPRADAVGVIGLSPPRAKTLAAVELGRALCRDITGTEPERMAPRRIAELCERSFEGSGVRVSVEHDVSAYPLLAAVARASGVVERHRPCVVTLDYRPEGEVRRTVLLAGKGVTYDTGGADLKTDGHMAGMSRDKGGAGAVAGLVRTLDALGVRGVRVVGLLGLVRNSVGEESYVSDEILRARSGVRVRIGNTDAEGRLVLADLLCAAREMAEGQPEATLFSIATLTGHVYRAYGPYVGVIGNARSRAVIDALDTLAEEWGEPIEKSRPRREDYTFVAARSTAEDVVSSNRLASVNTPRGHQFPFAFLEIASGLRRSTLPYVHMDIGGAAVDPPDWQFGKPTATPIATLAAWLGALG